MKNPETLSRAETLVPRYTSYPTAPHFTPQVGAATVGGWLERLDPAHGVSVYIHVPFCAKLCWYCGCNTSVTTRYEPVRSYFDTLLDEIAAVRARLAGRLRASHVHLGGGTPNALAASDLAKLAAALRETFAFDADTHFEVEIDPRSLDAATARALAEAGVTRVNLGIQDFDPKVQSAINRIQPIHQVGEKLALLYGAGLEQFGVDLLYGLPYQTPATLARTVAQVDELGASRVALFGYAHVPWMKPHQKLLEPHGLPDTAERLALAASAHAALAQRGYARIGIDHFARPDDEIAVAARDGVLRRNFQGYTIDTADTLLGFGPSAISAYAQGYAQNHARLDSWQASVKEGALPVARGLSLSGEDRVRRNAIERLMCDMTVDLGRIAQAHRLAVHPLDYFATSLLHIDRLAADGLCVRNGLRVTVPPGMANYARIVASAFDQYLARGDAKHSVAV